MTSQADTLDSDTQVTEFRKLHMARLPTALGFRLQSLDVVLALATMSERLSDTC